MLKKNLEQKSVLLFLMQELGLEYDEKHLQNHKAYIQSWLQIIKDKPNELFKAISESDKIVDYLKENSKELEKYNIIEENNIEMEMELA